MRFVPFSLEKNEKMLRFVYWQLSLEFEANGTVQVDYVSLLRQNTFNGYKNGQLI